MSKKNSISVLIVDDHPIFRRGLRNLLEADGGFVVIGEAADGRDAVALTRSLRPDVLLLDVAMPGATGFDVLRELGSGPYRVRTVMLTGSIDPSEITLALRLGAVGVLLKTAATELLFKCLRSVMEGEYWVGRDATGSLVDALKEAAPFAYQQRPFGLTARELDVVALVSTGASNKSIASELHLSEETVKHHLTNIFEKTGQSSRVELALFAAEHGLTRD